MARMLMVLGNCRSVEAKYTFISDLFNQIQMYYKCTSVIHVYC